MNKTILTFSLMALLLASVALAQCALDIQAKNTRDFLAEIPALNDKVKDCPVPLPGIAASLFGGDDMSLFITMQDNLVERVYFGVKDGAVVAVLKNPAPAKFTVTLTECQLDAILGAESRMGAFAYLYATTGQIKITGNTFWAKTKLLIAAPFVKSALKKEATEVKVECASAAPSTTKKQPGDICNHGGECGTGNCVGEGQGPPWTYRCSCDAFKYVAGPCQAGPAKTGEPGDICQHGGECGTGNCVGVGQGPPWTYKCSCHPSRFETGC